MAAAILTVVLAVSRPGAAAGRIRDIRDIATGTGAAIAVAAVTQSELRIEDLGEFLGERLARYKHPKGLEIVDALPRNPAGKVLKTELRTRYGVSNGP